MKILASSLFALGISTASAQNCSQMSLGQMANLNGFQPFSSSDAWNTPVAGASADLISSTTFLLEFGGGHLHFDAQIPYTVVDTSTHGTLPVTMNTYPGNSDIMPYPLGPDVAIEGSPAQCTNATTDQHAIVIDRKTCFAYETWQTTECNSGGNDTWTAANGSVWDLNNNEHRPYGWTSADAAGLPIFPGLVKYEEVQSGAIHHALRFTLSHTRNDANGGLFTAPASHAAGNNWATSAVIGMRFRLRADFDVSGYSAHNQTILNAMKEYGMILADNGTSGYFQGTPDPRWTDDDLNGTKSVPLSAFEVVSTGNSIFDALTAPTGPAPTVSTFVASSYSTTAGTPVTLSWTSANDSYDFIDVVGPVRDGSVVVTPTATTTYTLNATNQFGRTTKTVTVTVNAASNTSSSATTDPTKPATTTSGSSTSSGASGTDTSSTGTTSTTSLGTGSSTTSTTSSTSGTGSSTSSTTGSTTSTSTSGSSTGSGSTGAAWIRIANEGDTFAVPAGSVIRYGVPGAGMFDAVKIFKTATVITASNAFFGGDPDYGVVKEVDIYGSAAGVKINGQVLQ